MKIIYDLDTMPYPCKIVYVQYYRKVGENKEMNNYFIENKFIEFFLKLTKIIINIQSGNISSSSPISSNSKSSTGSSIKSSTLSYFSSLGGSFKLAFPKVSFSSFFSIFGGSYFNGYRLGRFDFLGNSSTLAPISGSLDFLSVPRGSNFYPIGSNFYPIGSNFDPDVPGNFGSSFYNFTKFFP